MRTVIWVAALAAYLDLTTAASAWLPAGERIQTFALMALSLGLGVTRAPAAVSIALSLLAAVMYTLFPANLEGTGFEGVGDLALLWLSVFLLPLLIGLSLAYGVRALRREGDSNAS